jgi:hypothetical protein
MTFQESFGNRAARTPSCGEAPPRKMRPHLVREHQGLDCLGIVVLEHQVLENPMTRQGTQNALQMEDNARLVLLSSQRARIGSQPDRTFVGHTPGSGKATSQPPHLRD